MTMKPSSPLKELPASGDVQMQDAEPLQQDQPDQEQEEQELANADVSNQSGPGTGQDQDDGQEEDEDEGDGEDDYEGEDQEGDGEDEGEEDEEEAAQSDSGAGSDAEPKPSKPKGRGRGRPPGGGSNKVHRGHGRGPLTLSRRGRGRPRGSGARGRGSGRILHEGNIIGPTSGAEGEGAEGAEGEQAPLTGGAITVGGKEYQLIGDELALDSDEDGDKKIDAKGNLQGGREWKPHAFCSPMRPDPQCVYMLSIDAARAAGYRDSLYFFRKNPLLVKLNLMQGEKDVLIDGGRLSGTLRGRNVTMVAARNVFKLHGPRVIKNGRAVTD